MGIMYVSQKSKASHKKGVKPYSSPKRLPAYQQGVLEVVTPYRRTTEYIPSRETSGYAACVKPADKKYTGSNILGIGTMHKSNAVPIFNNDEAKDIASMRRN